MITHSRIHRLPQVVADAIAAGEVIERPASAVKELVENALDAGARRVDVAIDGGGLVRIEVVDDGDGIAADDLELAVSRHATSKIAAASDLSGVATLGFRGEALASIAAVSDLRIVSRTGGDATAATVRVRYGEVVERAAAGAAAGTRVEVSELFAATPARLRFLRSAGSEAAACARAVADLAITHPGVAFTCRIDGRVTVHAPGGTMRDALRAVFGARAEQELIDIDAPGSVGVTGAISAPHANRATRAGLVLVVNGRRVHNRALAVACEEAYVGLIPSGRHPFGCVAVDVEAATVDVNVHPAKREVRFKDERAVFAAVQRACWAALRAAPVYAVRSDTAGAAAATGAELTLKDADGPFAALFTEAVSAAAGEPAQPTRLADLRPLRALAQAGSAWLVAEAPGAVVLVDPHAAHEKVLYAQLIDQWSGGAIAESQLLLIPAVVECDPERMQRFEESAAFIARCGFTLEVFGPGVLRCTAVPAPGRAADPERLVIDLLDALDDERGVAAARQHRVAALVACHGAVRLGDRIGLEEQQQLLDLMVGTPGGMTCPHGRPAVIVFDDSTLRRAFRRPVR